MHLKFSVRQRIEPFLATTVLEVAVARFVELVPALYTCQDGVVSCVFPLTCATTTKRFAYIIKYVAERVL